MIKANNIIIKDVLIDAQPKRQIIENFDLWAYKRACWEPRISFWNRKEKKRNSHNGIHIYLFIKQFHQFFFRSFFLFFFLAFYRINRKNFTHSTIKLMWICFLFFFVCFRKIFIVLYSRMFVCLNGSLVCWFR